MAKIGRFVMDPRAGAYCPVTLDSGEKLVVTHDKGGFKGGLLSIEISKLMGLSSQRIFECDLDTPAGKAALAALTADAVAGTAAASPLGGFVNYVAKCASVDEVKRRCGELMAQPT